MKLGIILGSTRSKRLGERVALWVKNQTEGRPEIQVEILDLKEYPLPFYEEAELPSQLVEYADQAANAWRDKIIEKDAFVIVHPEYNHGYSAVLKNAIDYLYQPWVDKPALLVSYSSGPIGGARAAEQLRPVLGHVGLIVTAALHLGRAQDILDEQGTVKDGGPFDSLLAKQIAPLLEWDKVLQEKRAN